MNKNDFILQLNLKAGFPDSILDGYNGGRSISYFDSVSLHKERVITAEELDKCLTEDQLELLLRSKIKDLTSGLVFKTIYKLKSKGKLLKREKDIRKEVEDKFKQKFPGFKINVYWTEDHLNTTGYCDTNQVDYKTIDIYHPLDNSILLTTEYPFFYTIVDNKISYVYQGHTFYKEVVKIIDTPPITVEQLKEFFNNLDYKYKLESHTFSKLPEPIKENEYFYED